MKLPLLTCCLLALHLSIEAQNDYRAFAQTLIDSIHTAFAPDKRTAVFEIALLETPSGKWTCKGSTDQPEALKTLESEFKRLRLDIDMEVEILPESILGEDHFGLVNVSVANLRTEPRHGAELATQALLGTPLKILRQNGEWYQVQTPDYYIAWLESGAFVRKNAQAMQQWRLSERVIFMGDYALCYPVGESQAPWSDLCTGAILMGDDNSEILEFPDGRRVVKPDGPWLSLNTWKQRTGIAQDSLLAEANKLSGRPYLWGGTSAKGLDCSGFTRTVYFLHGVIIPRDASQQVKVGAPLPLEERFAALQPGDFLFFGNYREDGSPRVTHVGLYVGKGMFIHSGADNGVVRTQSLIPGNPGYQEHRRKTLLFARRLRPGDAGVMPVATSNWYFEQPERPTGAINRR